jgi:hypothetical protein
MKFALLAAVQAHPLPDATVTDALPPSGPNVVVVCPRENVQDVGGDVGLPPQALAARSASRGSTQQTNFRVKTSGKHAATRLPKRRLFRCLGNLLRTSTTTA